MATINMHMKFETEIPKETWLMLRKPCRLQTDGRTDGQTDGQGESSIPPTNFVGRGYNYLAPEQILTKTTLGCWMGPQCWCNPSSDTWCFSQSNNIYPKCSNKAHNITDPKWQKLRNQVWHVAKYASDHWTLVMPYDLIEKVNIASVGLLADGTKPLLESILNYCFILGFRDISLDSEFTGSAQNIGSLKHVSKF